MKNIIDKIREAGNENLLLTERGINFYGLIIHKMSTREILCLGWNQGDNFFRGHDSRRGA
jgi:3-deoxy-D-manno-octulosonic acid (KDO) 8-phosphate synthase